MHDATQTKFRPGPIIAGMDRNVSPPEIVAVERLSDGILVKFNDGRCVFYPVSLLHELIPQAELQNEKDLLW